ERIAASTKTRKLTPRNPQFQFLTWIKRMLILFFAEPGCSKGKNTVGVPGVAFGCLGHPARTSISPLMKLRDAVTFTGLIFLVVTQTIVFVRLESIERRFSGKTGYEALDRSLASMQRTVDALSSGQPGSKSPSVSLAGSATPRLPDRLSDTVKD